jgi:hypothetical protein
MKDIVDFDQAVELTEIFKYDYTTKSYDRDGGIHIDVSEWYCAPNIQELIEKITDLGYQLSMDNCQTGWMVRAYKDGQWRCAFTKNELIDGLCDLLIALNVIKPKFKE